MTGNNTRDKLRGLFLAAIMVTSVFVGFIAFAGTAAAANQDLVKDPIHYQDPTNDDGVIELAFEGDVNVNGDFQVGVAGLDEVTVGQSYITATGGQVEIDMAQYAADNNLADNGVFPRVENVTYDVAAAGDSSATASDTVDVRFAGASLNVATGSPSSSNQFEGTTIALFDNAPGTSNQVTVESDSVFAQPSTGVNSEVALFDTTDRALEVYNVSNLGGGDDLQFRLRDLGLTATSDESEFFDDEDITGTVSSDSSNRDILIELLDEDDDVVADTETEIGAELETDFTFGSQDTGDYTVEVTDLATGVTASTDTISVVAAPDADASFGEIEGDQRGDIVEIPIEVTGQNTANITIGSDGVGYNVSMTVEDGVDDEEDEDGVVTLKWNTYNAGTLSGFNANPSSVFTVADSDDEVRDLKVTTSDIDGQDDIIEAGTYEVAVGSGEDGPPNPSADSLATVRISERESSETGISLLTAPDSVDPQDDVDLAYIQDNVGSAITPASNIAENDHLIAAISAQGLEGAVNATGANNDLGKFAGIHAGSAGEGGFSVPDLTDPTALNLPDDQIVIEAVEVDPGPNQDADVVNVEPVVDQVVADTANDTYYVVIDNDDGALSNALEEEDDYNLEFNILPANQDTNNYGLVAPNEDDEFENETASAQFDIVDEEATIDGPDTLEVQAQDGVTITGTSTVAPGAELDIQVSSQRNEPSQFINTSTATVQTDGTWSADFGDTFADAVEGTNFDIEVTYEGRTLSTDTDTGVVEGEPVVNTLTFEDQEVVATGTQTVVVQNVNLSDGGFIAIHQGGPGGPVIGNSDYIAENTDRTNIAISLSEQLPQGETTLVAMAHQDTNNNQEYEFDGGAVDAPYPGDNFVSSATITAGQAQPTETDTPDEPTETDTPDTPDEPTETDTPDTPDEPTETDTPDEPADTTTDGAGSPGFGVTAAIVALLGAAFLALRRRA
ncbi:DUF7282 domain-containing protein [Salinirussus salinus]|uniref:DUF7282 domain-containing protein n=1 Tax=Salinirussus salinus TaxID=1198300 RepID=UPI001915D422|nr:BGTF surface domain-containing protein [Salinirussus salinus]